VNTASALHVTIWPEEPEDVTAVRHVNALAFDGPTEANIVDAVRAAGEAVLSMVAVDESGRVVGHALFSPVTVAGGHGESTLLGLGPVSVLPPEQHNGIGTLLIDTCLERLRTGNHAGVVVLGHPHFYHRFGFIPASRWGLRWEADAPDENFMALELSAGLLTGIGGVVRYRPEFVEA
jgi:putative acetyltransferase